MTPPHLICPRHRRRCALSPLLPLLALGAWAAAHADTLTDDQWHGGVSLGGSASSGNTDTTVLSGNVNVTKATAQDKLNLYGLANYGRSSLNGVRTTSADQARAGARWDENLSAAVFGFVGGAGETNKVAGLHQRVDLNLGAGYKLLNSPRNGFDVVAGFGYADLKFTDGQTHHGGVLLVGEESSTRLTDTTTFKQRLAFTPGQDGMGRLATFDAGLATEIFGGWTMNTALDVRYTSAPAPGFKSVDTLVTLGFGYKF